MPAYFTCKHCGQEHPSPLFFDSEQSFHGSEFGSNTLACPVTGKTATYDKRSMVWFRREEESTYFSRTGYGRTVCGRSTATAIRPSRALLRAFAFGR